MNIFGFKIGNRSSSQQTGQTPAASPQASPLPAGRAGRMQRQNALSPDVRYNAQSVPSTPDRARANARYGGGGSSPLFAPSPVRGGGSFAPSPARGGPGFARSPVRGGPSVPPSPARGGGSFAPSPARDGPGFARSPARGGPSFPPSPARGGPSFAPSPGRAGSSFAPSPGRGSQLMGLKRQHAKRESPDLAKFHNKLQSSVKTSRSDPLPETAETLPKRLQEKVDMINLPKLKKLDPGLYNHAKVAISNIKERIGPTYDITGMDKKNLPLLADAQNARHPDLNLHVFKNSQDCFKAIRDQNKNVQQNRQPVTMRALYPPFHGMPDHHIALDVQLKPGKHPSIVGFESSVGNMVEGMEAGIKGSLPNAKLKFVHNIIQKSSTDCIMFALSNALKSFQHHDEFTARLHKGEQGVPLPAEFLKHAHSQADIADHPFKDNIVTKDRVGSHSETLMHRNLAYRADRGDRAYSTSIEGFRLQMIQRAADFLKEQVAKK